jgi:hypothetical protein
MEVSLFAISAIVLLVIMFAMAASWLIKSVTGRVAAEFSDPDPELSRVRPRR